VYNTVCGWCLRFRAEFDPVYCMDFCVILNEVHGCGLRNGCRGGMWVR
jgi:hypothetical protein